MSMACAPKSPTDCGREGGFQNGGLCWAEEKGRLYKWASPDGQYRNQINCILCSIRWRISALRCALLCRSVVSDSLRPHGLQLPCPSPSPGACSNPCPSSWWCHPTISSSVPFSSCLPSFPGSGSFSVSRFFTSGGQSIGTSASASVLPMYIQG